MARKIFYSDPARESHVDANTVWHVGLYIRLSREDDNDLSESNSITNQRFLLSDYMNNKSGFRLKDIYVDDGFSGINFTRPGFQRMLKDIKSSLINCVIVKDLSRLGRDMTGVRHYLEQLFPSLNCRFISIIDHLDSYDKPEEINSIFVQFKHLMNEHYCREISQKTRATFDSMRRAGKLLSAFAPYGYRKDPDDKHHLVIDSLVSDNVRAIFKLCLDGYGVTKIAQHMNTLRITSPTKYRVQLGDYKSYNVNCTPLWLPSTIRIMLKNKAYIGILEQKKHITADYKTSKRIQLPESKRIIAENTHEAIISFDDFNKVQARFAKCTYTPRYRDTPYLFSGFLRCVDCNRGMLRTPKRTEKKTYIYYKCRTYCDVSKEKCPHPHAINHNQLKEIVFQAVKSQIYVVANLSNILNSFNTESAVPNQIAIYNRMISIKQRTIESKYTLKVDIYEDWKSKRLTDKDYTFMKEKYDNEIKSFEKAIDALEQKKVLLEDMKPKDIAWIKKYAEHYCLTNLTRPMLLALVDTIYIGRDKTIRIKFNYQDEFTKLLEVVEENQVYLKGNHNLGK